MKDAVNDALSEAFRLAREDAPVEEVDAAYYRLGILAVESGNLTGLRVAYSSVKDILLQDKLFNLGIDAGFFEFVRYAGLENDKDVVKRVGAAALNKGRVLDAKWAYFLLDDNGLLDDKSVLTKLGDLAFRSKFYYDASQIYARTDDHGRIRKLIVKVNKIGETGCLDQIIPVGLKKELDGRFAEWHRGKGFADTYSYDKYEVLNAANVLAPDYDIGIGNAKGGLFSSFYFSLFDLPVILAQTHHTKSRVTFRWHDSPEVIEGKKIIVFDQDIKSGKSLDRLIGEIGRHNPSFVDIFLNFDPVDTERGIGSKISNMPKGFRKVFYPELLSYDTYFDALMKVEEKWGYRK